METGFFQQLAQHTEIEPWLSIIDWLLQDKFPDKIWSSGYVGKYIKAVKRFDGLSNGNYIYLAAKDIKYPVVRSKKSILICFGKGNGEARDLLRHIRNAVAHNNATVFNRRGKCFFEFKDFLSDGKTQTAYMIFPVDYLMNIYQKYCEIEKSISHSKKKMK